MEIILYVWNSKNGLKRGQWHNKIKIRSVPFSRYYQQIIAKLFYKLWVWIDQPDKILCNFLWHGESGIFNRDRDIIVFHNPYSQLPNRYVDALQYLSSKSSIVFDSQDSFNQFKSLKKDFTNCTIINTGVDTNYFSPSSKKRLTRSLKLICISEFEERKGIQYLIKAFPTILNKLDATLKIYGSGRYKTFYHTLINDLCLNEKIKIKEPVKCTKAPLKDADIYFLLSEGEGFPMGLLEAMACGIPAITSNLPPFDEIDSDVIYKVDRNNEIDICTALEKFNDEAYYETISKISREYVEKNHSWVKIAQEYYLYVVDENE